MRKLLTFICTLLVAIGASATINRNLHASVVLEKKTTTENELNLSTVGIRQAIIGEVEMADEPTMEEWNAEYVAKQQKAAEYAAHDYYSTAGMMHFGYTPQFYRLQNSFIAVPYLDSVVWTNYYGPTNWYMQHNDELVAKNSETYVTGYGIDDSYNLPYTTDHTLTQGDQTYNIKGYKYAAGNENGGYLASAVSPIIISTGEMIPLTLCGMETDPMNNESGADFYQISASARGAYAYGTDLIADTATGVTADTLLSKVRNLSPLKISAVNIPVYNKQGTTIMPEGGQVKVELFAADLTQGIIYTDSILATAVATIDNFLEVQTGLGTIVATFQEEDKFGGMMDVAIVVEGDFVVQLTGYNESGCDFGIYADYYTPGGTTMYKVGGKYTPIFSASSNLAISYDAYWPIAIASLSQEVLVAPVEGGVALDGEYSTFAIYTNVADVDEAWVIDEEATSEWLEFSLDDSNLETDGYLIGQITAEALPTGMTGRKGVVVIDADGYKLSIPVIQGDVSNPAQTTITYELNGGVTNDDNWLNKNDMFQACMADCGVTGLATLDELKASADPYTTICGKLTDVTSMLSADKWEWLELYIMTVQNADVTTPATVLEAGVTSAGWRYAVAAFFVESQRTGWPKSADFSSAGKDEAYIPAWKHAYANPTAPEAEWVLNAPYKEGATFDGWYAAADFSGKKITTVNAETTGTLYAKWVEYIPTIAEVRALADDTETKVAGVVNHVNGKNIYIQDYTGGILVYTLETPSCKVGDKIVAKGVKGMFGGAPEVKSAVIESTEAASVAAPTEFETLTPLLADSLEHKYFATNVTIADVTIVEYDSFNNPTVQDATGNKALCYKMELDPVVFPIGTKVSVTAVAGWYKGFRFVGDAAGLKVVPPKKDNYTYPTRDGRYTLTNNWVISNIEDNFAANKPGSTDYVRGMAAKDGIMYFINRETESLVRVDGETGKMLEPLKLTGDHLFQKAATDSTGAETWSAATILPFNDIKFDQAGNCLIGACLTGSTLCQHFMIYTVDLETGACTKLIDDVLWENTGLDGVTFRFDAFGVAGDVTKNGVVMAADANDGWKVYRWLITDGVVGEGEQIAIVLDPAIDKSLYIDAAGFGTGPQIFPQDEEGSLFYVDGFNTLPMLFYGDPAEGAMLLDDFINVPTGTKVWNNAGDTISMNTQFNGLVEFQVGEEYFLLMVAANNTHSVPITYALYKFADADRTFAGMEPLWYFPHNGLGTTTIGCRTAPVSVEVVDDHTAKLYLYAVNNGYASYTFATNGSYVPSTTASITVNSSNTSMGTVSGSGVYKKGENVQISATANYGYHFSHWNDGNTQNPRTVKVTEDKTYTAYFERSTYTITKHYNTQHGSISGSTSGKYLDVISLTAIPNTGYHFSQWHDGVTDNPRSFVLTQDTTFAAFFAVNHYQLNISTNNPDAGTVSGAGTYEYGTYTEISATANYGYHFSHWNDGNTENPRTVKVTGDRTYTAYFDNNTYSIYIDYDRAYGVVTYPTSGKYKDEINLKATPNLGYTFVGWSDGIKDNPRTIVLEGDIYLSANFTQAYSGQCGDNAYWKYDPTSQTISIMGFGEMYHYTPNTQPWILFKEKIRKVEIANDVTSLGTSAFAGCRSLGEVHIGHNLIDIYTNAFADCKRLYHVYCYPTYPPFADISSFANYTADLHIPCESKEDYVRDEVWGKFSIKCLGAETEELPSGEVTTTTTNSSVTITWPTDESADTYTIEIKRGDQVFCTLTFSKEGQLMNIAFISGRDGQNRAQYAESTTQGLRFTITRLDSGTQYSYDITTRDENNDVIDSYTGEFTTQSDVTTNIDNVPSTNPRVQKILLNGQLYILREGKTYSVLGQEIDN